MLLLNKNKCMAININWNICRVCLLEENQYNTTGQQMRNIFNAGKKLAKCIYECTGVTMKPDDSLPHKICQKCLVMVNNTINFRMKCRSSNNYLQSILQCTKAASTLFKPKEGLQINSSDKEEKVIEVQTFREETEDLIIEQCIEQSPETIANYIKSNITKESRAVGSSSKEVKENFKSKIIPKKVSIEYIGEEEDEIIEVYENEIDIASNNGRLTINPKRQKMKTTQISKYCSLTMTTSSKTEIDIEQLEENIECNLFSSKNKSISKDEINTEGEYDSIILEDCIEYLDIEEDNDKVEYIKKADSKHGHVAPTVETTNDFSLLNENSNLSNSTYDFARSKKFIEDKCVNKDFYSKNTNVESTNKMPTESRKIRALKNITVRTSTVALGKHNIKHTNFKSKGHNRCYEIAVYTCKICGNQFNSNRQKFYLHMKKHRQEKSYQCELCSKRIYTVCNLQAHIRVHTGEKPFECQYCGRRFSDRSSNLRHERIHTNVKPFQCNNCGKSKSFALATTLRSHMKIHTEERFYKCEPCEKSFKLPHHLKSHQKTALHKAV